MSNMCTVADQDKPSETSARIFRAKLREFYEAATAPMMALYALHSPGCHHMGQFGKCDCGGLKREARLEKARAAIVEASGEDVT
jgi:hypothetical protein